MALKEITRLNIVVVPFYAKEVKRADDLSDDKRLPPSMDTHHTRGV